MNAAPQSSTGATLLASAEAQPSPSAVPVAAPQPAKYSAVPCRRCRNLNFGCDQLQPSCIRCDREGASCVYGETNNVIKGESPVSQHATPTMAPPQPPPAAAAVPAATSVSASPSIPAVPLPTESRQGQRSPSQFMYTSVSNWAAANGANSNAQFAVIDNGNTERPASKPHSVEPMQVDTVSKDSDDTPQRQQGKRKRTSCSDCHKRKLKCDREYPACGRCKKRGVPCYYDDWSSVTVASKPRVRQETPPKPAPARYGILTGQPTATNGHQPAADIPYASPYGEYIDQSRRTSDYERPAQKPRYETSAITPGTFRAALQKEIQTEGGQKKPSWEMVWQGPTDPHSTLLTFPELTAFATGNVLKTPSLSRVRDGMKGLRRKDRTKFDIHNDHGLIALLPDEGRIDRHVRDYFHAYSHIYPIIQEYHFRDQLDFFKTSSGRVTKPGFVAVLLLVLACAAVVPRNDPLSFCGDSSLARYEASKWIKAVESWLDNQSQKHPTLEVFQVHCLLLIASKVTAYKVKRVWTQAGNSLRFAMAAGLHCSPSFLDKSMSPTDQELRRRIWHTLRELELQASIDRGMPATLTPTSSTCEPPLNIDDHSFRNANEDPNPGIREDYIQTSSSFLRACATSFDTRCEVISILNDLSGAVTYADILRLDAHVNSELARLPRYTGTGKSVWLSNSSPDGMAGLGPAMLQCQLLQLLVLMHTPFAARAGEDARYKYSQMAALEAAERVLDLFVKQGDEERRTVLSLLRNDVSRTCISVCQILLASGSSTLVLRSIRTPFLALVSEGLQALETKVVRLGQGFELFWLVASALELVRSGNGIGREREDNEAEKARAQALAAEKLTNIYYKIIANQEAPPAFLSDTSLGLLNGRSNGTAGGANGATFGATGAEGGRWYGAAIQAAEEAGTSSTGAPSTNGGGEVDVFDMNWDSWAMDDLNFTNSELFML